MKFNTFIITALLSTSLSYAIEGTTPETTMQAKQEGLKYIKMLGGALKSELKTHMKADKTGLSAMGFCSAKAETITKEVNDKLPKHASVRRTALKIRNPENIADALDQKIIKAYEERIADKTFLPTDITVVQNNEMTRVYKPLIIQGVCLKCHGNDISQEIQKEIQRNYPKDQAIGYKIGALRGVIVAEMKK